MDLGWETPDERGKNKSNQQYVIIHFCNYKQYLVLLITPAPASDCVPEHRSNTGAESGQASDQE